MGGCRAAAMRAHRAGGVGGGWGYRWTAAGNHQPWAVVEALELEFGFHEFGTLGFRGPLLFTELRNGGVGGHGGPEVAVVMPQIRRG